MASVTIDESIDLDKMLGNLPIEMRSKGLKKAVKQGATIQRNEARRRAPVETPNVSQPDKRQLKDTIAVVTREYQGGKVVLAISGPSQPHGAHGGLQESGHEVKVNRGERKGQAPLTGSATVPGKKWFAPSVDTTQNAVESKVETSLASTIREAGG